MKGPPAQDARLGQPSQPTDQARPTSIFNQPASPASRNQQGQATQPACSAQPAQCALPQAKFFHSFFTTYQTFVIDLITTAPSVFTVLFVWFKVGSQLFLQTVQFYCSFIWVDQAGMPCVVYVVIITRIQSSGSFYLKPTARRQYCVSSVLLHTIYMDVGLSFGFGLV